MVRAFLCMAALAGLVVTAFWAIATAY